MTPSWSVLFLALFAADGQPPSPPRISSSPIPLACRPGKATGSVPCCVCLAQPIDGECALLDEIGGKHCPEDILDERTGAASGGREGLKASILPMAMPKVAKPRTNGNPEEPQEAWPMTLPEAIRIGLDNSEILRVIAFGTQGIPIAGVEPPLLNTGAGIASSLGSGTLQSVYDPAILETQIVTALSTFDTAFTTSILRGDASQPFNNGVQGGSLSLTGTRYPNVSVNDSATCHIGTSKRTTTGASARIVHNVYCSYPNSSFLVWPSAYTTNLQLTLTQPLLGSAPLHGQAAGPPVGLDANRAPIVIARLNADAGVWRFKAEVMAQVRSIEQQYWNLAQAHVQLGAADRAATLAKEVYEREQAELMSSGARGGAADVAEAAQRLEQFQLDLVARTSDVITTERQLRNLLGLPPADNRRIIPVTPPTEAKIEPDWDLSLAEMLESQPDVVQQRVLVQIAALQLLVARTQLFPQLNVNALYQLDGIGRQSDSSEAVSIGRALSMLGPFIAASRRAAVAVEEPRKPSNFLTWQDGIVFQCLIGGRGYPWINTRHAQYVLLRSQAYYQQVVHQTTHSLARFFLEIDANYKQFKTASRLRAAAAQRLEAQRAYYKEGRITIDRFLDAVSQYATAVATEAQYKTAYNISLAALEEAKGTLLAFDNIVVAESPRKRTITAVVAAESKSDSPVVKTAFTSENPTAIDGLPPLPRDTNDAPKCSTPAKSRTWSFTITLGGAKPLQIKGTITAGAGETPSAAH
jgi:outer membrane protein TolC